MSHSPDLFSHPSNVSNIFDESLNQSTSSSLDSQTQRLSNTHIEEPRTPGANVVYKGSMRGQSPTSQVEVETIDAPARPSMSDARTSDSRENELILERDRLRTLNGVLENSISTFRGAQDKMQRFSETIQTTHDLMDLYVSLLSQAEHNQRLLLNPEFEMDKDVEQVLQAQREEEEQERRKEKEEREKEERMRTELREKEEQEAAAAARKAAPPVIRGRGRGRGTTRSVPVKKVPSTDAVSTLPGRGSATVTGVRGVRGIRSRATARGRGSSRGASGD